MTLPEKRGIRLTLSGAFLVALVVVILVALLIQLSAVSHGKYRTTGCASNLRTLMQAQFNYASQYGRPNGDMPDETGVAFWLKLQRTAKPVLDRHEVFVCPVSEEKPGPGRCSYRGPALPIRTMASDDPVAADKDGNHGPGQGGNLLTERGDVGEYEETHPLWIRARVTTKE